MSSSHWCPVCKLHYINVYCDLHCKPPSTLDDIAEFHDTWQFVMWLIPTNTAYQYKRSTKGHYYHSGAWHPLSVNQRTYVMDDYGQLQLVYDDL